MRSTGADGAAAAEREVGDEAGGSDAADGDPEHLAAASGVRLFDLRDAGRSYDARPPADAPAPPLTGRRRRRARRELPSIGAERRRDGRRRACRGFGGEELVQVDAEVGLRRRRLERGEDAVDLALHLAGRREAVVGVARQRLEDQRVDLQRQPRIEIPRRLDPAFAHGVEDRHLAFAGEEPPAGEHLEQQRAEREDVGTRIDRASPGLLGGHVLELALERAHLRLRGLGDRLDDAEVAELDVAFVADQDVLGRDVAVHEAEGAALEVLLTVRMIERRGETRTDQQRQAERQRAALGARAVQDRAQVLAVDELHRDEVVVADLAEVVDVDDVVVIELGGELGLVDEHRDEVGAVGEVRQDLLDGDRLLEALDALHARLPDLRHAADRDPLEQGVLTELARRRLQEGGLDGDLLGREALLGGGPGRRRALLGARLGELVELGEVDLAALLARRGRGLGGRSPAWPALVGATGGVGAAGLGGRGGRPAPVE